MKLTLKDDKNRGSPYPYSFATGIEVVKQGATTLQVWAVLLHKGHVRKLASLVGTTLQTNFSLAEIWLDTSVTSEARLNESQWFIRMCEEQKITVYLYAPSRDESILRSLKVRRVMGCWGAWPKNVEHADMTWRNAVTPRFDAKCAVMVYLADRLNYNRIVTLYKRVVGVQNG